MASLGSTITCCRRCGRPLYGASSTRLRSTRISRTSSGRARMRMLVMSALTHTLLPEPVAPATSRWGILREVDGVGLARHVAARARTSAGWAPRASGAPRGTAGSPRPRPPGWGSRCPPRPCPGWAPRCGWSVPPGPSRGRRRGASIRDSFTWRSGLTSYWVTTGPVFVATTLAGIGEAAQLLLDEADVRGVVDAAAGARGYARLEEVDRRQRPARGLAALRARSARRPPRRWRRRPRARAGRSPIGAVPVRAVPSAPWPPPPAGDTSRSTPCG